MDTFGGRGYVFSLSRAINVPSKLRLQLTSHLKRVTLLDLLGFHGSERPAVQVGGTVAVAARPPTKVVSSRPEVSLERLVEVSARGYSIIRNRL